MVGRKKSTKARAPKAARGAKKATATSSRSGFEKATKARTKAQIMTILALQTELAKRDVQGVFGTLSDLISNDLSKGPGVFTIPGLMKITVVRKPATKARKGINPFNGEEITFKAKPARNVVKIRALKGLKDMV